VPGQKQWRWSHLKIDVTVLVAAIALAVRLFLMSGASDLFTRKIILRTYAARNARARNGRAAESQKVPDYSV
jgi:hypothetical protein